MDGKEHRDGPRAGRRPAHEADVPAEGRRKLRRYQFDYGPEVQDAIARLTERMGASSQSETIRRCVLGLDALVRETPGARVQSRAPDGTIREFVL